MTLTPPPRRGLLARIANAIIRAAPLPIPRWEEVTNLFVPTTRLDTTPRQTHESQLSAYTGYVYAAASTISGDIRANDWDVWRVSDPEDPSTWERQPRPPELLRPNALLTSGGLFELWSLHKDLTGEFYLATITQGAGGGVLGYQVIYPHWVQRAVQDEETGLLLGWAVQVPGRSIRIIPAADMIFDVYPHPSDPLKGASPVEAFAVSYDMDLYARAYGSSLMKNNSVPPMVITTKSSTVTPQQADEIRARWKERYLGRTDQIGVLPKDTTVQTLGLKLSDAGFLEMAQLSKEQILQIYKVPPSKLGDVKDGVSRANAEALDHTYNANALWPRLQRISETVNTHMMPRLYPGAVLGPVAGGLVFAFKNPIQADKEFRAANAHEAFRAGAIKIGPYLNELGITTDDPDDILALRAKPGSIEYVSDEDVLAEPEPVPAALAPFAAGESPEEDEDDEEEGEAPQGDEGEQDDEQEDEERAFRSDLRGMFSGWQATARAEGYESYYLDPADLERRGLSRLDARLYPRPAEPVVAWYERLKSSVAAEIAAGRNPR